MARTAKHPIEEFFSFLERGDINQFLSSLWEESEEVRESIAIASPSLYEKLQKLKTSERPDSRHRIFPNEEKNEWIDLLKYFLRMVTRATPFGLFSFVSLGKFDDFTSCTFDLTNVRKRARPDMEWLKVIIEGIVKDPNLQPQLSLMRNPLLMHFGGRVSLNYLKNEEKDKNEKLSIRSNFLIQKILQLANIPIKLEELISELLKESPSLEREKLLSLIQQLWEQNILSFTLFPSLLQKSPFSGFLSKISSEGLGNSQIHQIASQLQNYNKTPPGRGERELHQIYRKMKQIAEVSVPLQVDSFYQKRELSLPSHISSELAEALEVLWKLSKNNFYSLYLQSYHERFLERYGMDRAVPLLELLSDVGLGIPEAYTEDYQRKKWVAEDLSMLEIWLKNQWTKCLVNGEGEIEITDDIVSAFTGEEDKKKAALSTELYFELIASSPEEITRGNYHLLITYHSNQVGASFGRFIDCFDEKAQKELEALFEREESLEKESRFAEISFLPNIPRLANVSIHPNLRNHSIDLAGGGIPLEDILVSATSERFYLFQKGTSKELVVTAANMVNPALAPIPVRFMKDVSIVRKQQLFSFPWGGLSGSSFLPRVRYKKTIFSPAQWNVDLFQLGLDGKASLKSVETTFQKWADQLKVPRFFFLKEDDRRILIDQNHSVTLREIYKKLKKGMPLLLEEKIGQKGGQWVKSKKGTHVTEFVAPFIKNPKYVSESEILRFPQPVAISSNAKWKPPGTEWLYVQIYIDAEHQNRFLVEQFYPFLTPFIEKGDIRDWFFVRYADSRPHLRFRIHFEKKDVIAEFLQTLGSWTNALLEQQLILDMSIGTYEREIERYGGEILMEKAEALFSADSLTVLLLIHASMAKQTSLPEEVITALSLIDLLKGLGFNLEQQATYFSALTVPKSELSGFRKWKKDLVDIAGQIFEISPNLQFQKTIFYEAFQYRKEYVESFKSDMDKIRSEGGNIPKAIESSILHMHCNRVLGIERKKEIKAHLFAGHSIKTLHQKSLLSSNSR